MKKLLLAIILICSGLLTSCFSYKDVSEVIFVTALVMDYVDGEYVLYAEAFHSYRSNKTNTEKGERVLYESRGATVFDASREFSQKSSYFIDYSQNKVLIVTDRLAQKGLKGVLDLYERYQDLPIRSHILVFEGEPEKLLEVQLKEDEFMGIYLYQLLENPLIGASNARERINQFFNYRQMGDKVTTVSTLVINEELGEHKLTLDKSAIFKDDIWVGTLDYEDLIAYHFLIDEINIAAVVFPNPISDEGMVVIDVVKSKTKTELEFDGQTIRLIKKVKATTDLGGLQVPTPFDLETAKAFQQATDEVIKKNCEALFNKYKDQNLDIFDVKERMKRKYPEYEIENPLQITELVMEVETRLKGSDNITDYVK